MSLMGSLMGSLTGELIGVELDDLLLRDELRLSEEFVVTILRQEASFDSNAPTFRSKSLTILRADIRVDGDSNGSGCVGGH